MTEKKSRKSATKRRTARKRPSPKATRKSEDPNTLPAQEQVAWLFGFFEDVCTADDAGQLPSWLDHIGFDVDALCQKGADLWMLYQAHYRIKKGRYDINRMLRDVTTWEPIASRITELKLKQAEKVTQ